MMTHTTNIEGALRVYCVEDNPLIVFHIEQMIEDAGHIFAGFADSFAQLKIELDVTGVDGALVDIDLADGRTGPGVVAWLKERDIPCIFVTGQEEVAAQHADLAVAAIIKPVVASDLAAKIELFRGQRDT